MGSDIYTESAVAVRFEDFLNRKEIYKKSVRNDIVDELIQNNIVSSLDHSMLLLSMRDNKTVFINKLVNLVHMNDGYEDDREHNTKLLTIFCEHVGIDLDDLPECNFRSFESSRESGWDVEADVIYLMFEPCGLFETKMTKEGKKLAKVLGKESIEETTWTVHSY